MRARRAVIDDNDLRCFYCLHTKEQHFNSFGGCGACECHLFVSVSAWLAEGQRTEVPQP